MKEIKIITHFTIHPGKEKYFKELVVKCIAQTQKLDPDTLTYDWYYDEENSSCFALETYKDSNAVSKHTKDVWDVLQEIAKVADSKYYLLGHPSSKLLEETASSRSGLFGFFAGLEKVEK